MPDVIPANQEFETSPNLPKTTKTFIDEIRKALYAIPGVSKTQVDRFIDSIGGSFEKFSKLPHTLSALSAFLHYNIGVIAYKYGNSPQAFISTFTASPELVAEILKMTGPNGKVSRNFTISRNLFNPKSEQDKMVKLFDVEERKVVNFAPKEWRILPPPNGFLPIDPAIVKELTIALRCIYDPNFKKNIKKIMGQIQ